MYLKEDSKAYVVQQQYLSLNPASLNPLPLYLHWSHLLLDFLLRNSMLVQNLTAQAASLQKMANSG